MLKRSIFFIVIVNSILWQGCEYETVPGPVDCEENPVTVELVSVTDSNCELADGTIEVVASGGTGNFQYRLGDGDPQVSPLFQGVGAGVYEVTAFDGNTCDAIIQATVQNSNGMNITFVTTEAGGCNGTEGTLTVTAFDGTEPYQYRLGDGAFSSNHIFSNLSPGVYTLTVTDASGCEVMQSIRIRSGISFETSISPIIENSCAINDCHNGSQFPDFRVFKNIHDNAAQIKALTGDGTMPQEGTITQTEIDMIACWVDDGALDN